jgi:hypothetical protein
MGERNNVYWILMGKSGGKRPLGTIRHGQKVNVKIYLIEIRWYGVELICLAQDI